MAVAEAQSPIIKACWVEGSGVMYRRDTTGAPAACTVATHRPIEWTLGVLPGVAIPVPLSLSGSNDASAILVLSNTGNGQALFATASGTSAVARFDRSTGTGATVRAVNSATGDGVGLAFGAEGRGNLPTAELLNTGSSNALNATNSSSNSATISARNNATTGGSVISAENKGSSTTADFRNTGAANGGALLARSNANGNATAAIYNDGTGDALYTESKGGSPTFTARNTNTTNGFAFRGVSTSNIATGEFRNQGTGGALFAQSSGLGFAVNISSTNTAGARAIFAESKGTAPTITARNSGTVNGAAIQGLSEGNNLTGDFRNSGTGGALYLENVSSSANTMFVNARGGATAINTTSSSQNGVIFENTGTGNNIGILGLSRGVWPTAQFHNTNPSGFSLYAIGNARVDGNLQINGNYVATGTKNAVVPTSTGTREMYTEEATEVWFADYGQATLRDSAVWVPFDGTFSETIESDRPYHVFLQAYADAALFVSRRTAEGFEVRLAGNAAASQPIEFSYRLVAKRRGYSDRRLRPHALTNTDSKNSNVPQEPRR